MTLPVFRGGLKEAVPGEGEVITVTTMLPKFTSKIGRPHKMTAIVSR
jgi:hypothetical protein